MASIYDIKPQFQVLLRPLTKWLAAIGVTANQVTLAAVVLSVIIGLVIAIWPGSGWPLLALPAALLIRMALNAIDGMLAREHAMKSRLGTVLNELGDVVSDASLYLPLALVPGITASLIVTLTILAIIAEMTGIVAVQIGATRRYDGPLGKSDRAFAFGVLALILAFGVRRGAWMDIYLALMIVLAVLTIVNRARCALREVP